MFFSPERRKQIKSALCIAGALMLSSIAISGVAQAQSAPQRVKFETTLGNFTIELNAQKAPKSVANFLKYVEAKHYDGTIFHRVVPGFVVQGGGFTPQMTQKPTMPPVENEAKNGLANDVGTVAMARTADPNSATSQFYVNLVNNGMLNYPGHDGHGYAVFGKVVEGMDVINKMAQQPTGSAGGMGDVPRTPIVIQRAALVAGVGGTAGK